MSTNSNNQFVIDTNAWIEYTLGSNVGKLAKEHIESGTSLTPTIVIVELRKWFLKEIEAGRRREQEMRKYFEFIESVSRVVPLDLSLSLEAGQTDFVMKKRIKNWPITDSIIYATARIHGARVISGDPHLKGLEGVLFIG